MALTLLSSVCWVATTSTEGETLPVDVDGTFCPVAVAGAELQVKLIVGQHQLILLIVVGQKSLAAAAAAVVVVVQILVAEHPEPEDLLVSVVVFSNLLIRLVYLISESDAIPGGRIPMGGFLAASPKLVNLGFSREAKKAAAAASVFVEEIHSSSFCNILFQDCTKDLNKGRPSG
ncbi:hypothetical protein DM860_009688 [Cuscuta australis]|uniref:Uncharacterized protein n=1 Tax=Cuscuta australis TaxID=267555 RepID=A0A328DJX0_9ASTE|nr:hypothetical protein DM860_009688 [Cuscuta australis]